MNLRNTSDDNAGYTIDYPTLLSTLYRFSEYVFWKDRKDGRPVDGILRFRDQNGFLGTEEDYKSSVCKEARDALDIGSWKESDIGSGKILAHVKAAFNVKDNNLVGRFQLKRINELSVTDEEEHDLWTLYRAEPEKEEKAFEGIVNWFGGNYDVLSYLMFIKNDASFLPVRSRIFDQIFARDGINFKMEGCCNWENYNQYCSIVRIIKQISEQVLPVENHSMRLVDAHSILWITGEGADPEKSKPDAFLRWTPDNDAIQRIEENAERILNYGIPEKHDTHVSQFARSAAVVKEVKNRAHGICELCGNPAPFKDKHGEPFLEVHHIVWLSCGGEDSTTNAVALCPNCHRKMHILDNPTDIKFLQNITSHN